MMPPDQGFEQVTDLYTDLYFILILYILTSENIKLLLSCFYYIFLNIFYESLLNLFMYKLCYVMKLYII